MNKKKIFKKLYILYVILLFVFMVYCVGSVYNTLITFEKNQPENYIKNTLLSLNDEQIKSYFKSNENYESKDELVKNIRAFFKAGRYEIKKTDNMKYDIYYEEELLLKIVLNSIDHVNKFGIISYDVLEVEKIEGNNKGLYSYTITAPSNYKITVNNKPILDETSTEISGFSDGYSFASIPKINKYELNNLTKKPKIEINENGNKVNFKFDKNIDLSDQFKKYDTLSDANIDFDVKTFAEKWSLYLTNDLTGASHGFGTISQYFIKESSMYNKAYQWGTSIDITFTSKHTLKNPVFTNEKIFNVTIYNNSAASCDVKLEKNMVVSGKDKIDTFNSTIYLIKYNNEWKVINIKGVTGS